MSRQKILFFILVGGVILALIFAIKIFGEKANPRPVSKAQIKIWITDGVSEDFHKAFVEKGFYQQDASNKNIEVIVERIKANPQNYRNQLLETLANNTGPDIFAVPFGEDAFLERQVYPLSKEEIDISGFEKDFDSAVADQLVIQSGSIMDKKKYLLGIPLGYEQLGVFYNKNLLRTGVPSTWSQVEQSYTNSTDGIFPSNLGLNTRYVPNMLDIVSFFLINKKITSYQEIGNGNSAIKEYYTYGDLVAGPQNPDADENTPPHTLRNQEAEMQQENKKISTLDLFMQEKIAMIVGYPSLVFQLEEAYKANRFSENIAIATERIPQFSNGKRNSLVRFSYFGIYKNTKNFEASRKFLEYLGSVQAQETALKLYPHLVSAQTGLIASQRGKAISHVFEKANIDAFLPVNNERIFVFNYGDKYRMNDIFDKYFDQSMQQNNSNVGKKAESTITCEIETDIQKKANCEK